MSDAVTLVALGSHQIGLQFLQEVAPENAGLRLLCFWGCRLHFHLFLLDFLLRLHGFFGHKSDAFVYLLHELLRGDLFLHLMWLTWR